jgi:ubiquinone biosynthesis protein
MTAGSFTVGAELRGLDAVTNRLVYGLMIAALFLGSSFLLAFDVPPTVGGGSVLGLIGWVIGLALFISVMRAIRRRGGL